MSDESFEIGWYPAERDPVDRCISLLRDLAFEVSVSSWELKQPIIEFEDNTFKKIEFVRKEIEEQQKKVIHPSFTPNKDKNAREISPPRKITSQLNRRRSQALP